MIQLNELGVDLHVNLGHVGDGVFVDEITQREITLTASHIVVVGARLSNDSMANAVRAAMPEGRVHIAGDALAPGIIQAAVLSGHQAARNILAGRTGIAPTKRDQVTMLD